jgi:hypothetical protein
MYYVNDAFGNVKLFFGFFGKSPKAFPAAPGARPHERRRGKNILFPSRQRNLRALYRG